MIEKKRTFTDLLARRLGASRCLPQVLVGPRQVGKTTAVRTVMHGKGIYESADSPTPLPVSIIEDWWARALVSDTKTLAIDEVQKIPGWSEIIKRLWDRQPFALKVVLTGSSALLLEKGLTETLAGRFELIRATHWSLAEASEVFGLNMRQFVEFGCYPGSMPFLENVERWGAYIRDSIVEPAIGRDVLALHPVENPALLRQVFGAAVALPAQVVSLQKLQGHLQHRGSLPTLQTYLHLLGQAFLVSAVEKFSKSALRTRKSAPKVVVHDNALLRAFERPIKQELPTSRFGRYFENIVGARLIEAGWDVFYWKDRDLEVDYVAMGPQGERWAIEVKSGPIQMSELAGLRRFSHLHPEFEAKVVSLSKQELLGVKLIDAEEILSLSRPF